MTDAELAEFADDLEAALAGIPAEIREEAKRSRFRDRLSRMRTHPIQDDVNKLIGFVIARRRNDPASTFDVARAVSRGGDIQAVRQLVSIVLDGPCGWSMRRRCARLLTHCDQHDAALAQLAEWKQALAELEIREKEKS